MYVVLSRGDNGRLGGLAFLWTEEVTAALGSFSMYHIDMEVQWCGFEEKIRVTGFYGDLVVIQRKYGWEVLKQLRHRSSLPLVCAEDFNEIIDVREKWGGEERDQNQMTIFREALEHCELEDLGY